MNNELLLIGNLGLGLRKNDIKHLTDSCSKFEIKCRVVTSDKLYLEKKSPYAVINISGNPNASHMRFLRNSELSGTKFLNPVYDAVRASDKGLVAIELTSLGFNIPKTLDLPILQLDPDIFDYIEHELKFPCVVKIPNLGYGIGVFLVKDRIEFEDLYMLIWACASRTGDYLSNVNLIAQEYLPNNGQLTKVYILDNTIIGCYHQFYESDQAAINNLNNWKSSWRFVLSNSTPNGNISQSTISHNLWAREKRPPEGLIFKNIKLDSKIEQECLSIFKHLNLTFGSIDLLYSGDKYYYIDINTSPGLGLCYLVGQDEPIGDKLVKYLTKDLK